MFVRFFVVRLRTLLLVLSLLALITLSLFGVSIVEFAVWEYVRYRYPERFWEGSNRSLRCANCKDKLCAHKSYTCREGNENAVEASHRRISER